MKNTVNENAQRQKKVPDFLGRGFFPCDIKKQPRTDIMQFEVVYVT